MKKTAILFVLAAMIGCNNATETKKEETLKKDSTAAAAGAKLADATPPPQMDSAAMMKAMMDYGTPGEMHKWMASLVGKWDADVTTWMDPSKPPTKNKATGENKMIMGGRYQQSIFKGDMGGMPFEGMSTMAYDNAKKIFLSTWIDNMGTGIMNMEGTYDAASKTLNMKGKCTDPMSGKDCDAREVLVITDDKHHRLEMYMTNPGAKEMKVMEINYSKK